MLDIALMIALAALIWQLRREWIWQQAREQAFLHQKATPPPAQPLAPLPKAAPLTAVTYVQVAEKNLLSRDRNSNVIYDPPPAPVEKKIPPFPVARGVMLWKGVPPTVVLSDKVGGTQKGYHPGETLGEWKIVSVDSQYVVLEWDGQEFKKRIDELLDRTPITVAEAPAPQASNAPLQQVQAISAKPAPGVDVGGGHRGCVAGDSSPSGTVVDGMKKVVGQTPFGSSCYWEAAK